MCFTRERLHMLIQSKTVEVYNRSLRNNYKVFFKKNQSHHSKHKKELDRGKSR